MTDDRIHVAEVEPYWLPELQRQFPGGEARVTPLDASDLIDSSAGLPSLTRRLFLFDCGAPGSPVADLLQQVLISPPDHRPPIVVILRESAAESEWPLRELGVAAVLDDNTPGADVARLCRLLLSGLPRSAASVRV